MLVISVVIVPSNVEKAAASDANEAVSMLSVGVKGLLSDKAVDDSEESVDCKDPSVSVSREVVDILCVLLTSTVLKRFLISPTRQESRA